MYKAYLIGFEVFLTCESHTSKCSFLDNESVEHHNKFIGRRISCGLFRASNGRLINADVNAAYNIMKKAISNAISADGIEDIFKDRKK